MRAHVLEVTLDMTAQASSTESCLKDTRKCKAFAEHHAQAAYTALQRRLPELDALLLEFDRMQQTIGKAEEVCRLQLRSLQGPAVSLSHHFEVRLPSCQTKCDSASQALHNKLMQTMQILSSRGHGLHVQCYGIDGADMQSIVYMQANKVMEELQ